MKRKRLLVYSQAFYPDHSGIPIYSSDFAFYCAENGYDVDVITGFPFYPHWKKRPEDKGKLFAKEHINGVTIYRGYLYVPQIPTTFKRVIHDLSLILFAFFNSLRVKRPDIIVVFTTPVLLGFLAGFMNFFWRRKLIINVQDFQVEAAYSLDMFKGQRMLKLITSLEVWSYKKANFVSSISASMVELLINRKNISSDKVLFWPNWLHQNGDSSTSIKKGSFRKKFNIPDNKQLIGYAGNIGKKQGLEILIDVASSFSSNQEILFLIIGEGSGLQSLKEYANSKSVNNVLFLPFLNPEQYHEYLIDVDMVFISQAKTAFDVYFPSKLLGIMSFGKLLVVSADSNSELFKTLTNNNVALVADYGDVDRLIYYINLSLENKASVDTYKLGAIEYVKQFERKFVLSKLLTDINVN